MGRKLRRKIGATQKQWRGVRTPNLECRIVKMVEPNLVPEPGSNAHEYRGDVTKLYYIIEQSCFNTIWHSEFGAQI